MTRKSASTAGKAVGAIRVGMGGSVHAPWRDTLYPADLIQRHALEYVSRQVTAIEVKATYHRAQTPATYAKWAGQTSGGFVFTLKAPMRITKARALDTVGGHVEDVPGGLLAPGDRLGAVVWQFDSGPRWIAKCSKISSRPCPVRWTDELCATCSTCSTCSTCVTRPSSRTTARPSPMSPRTSFTHG